MGGRNHCKLHGAIQYEHFFFHFSDENDESSCSHATLRVIILSVRANGAQEALMVGREGKLLQEEIYIRLSATKNME